MKLSNKIKILFLIPSFVLFGQIQLIESAIEYRYICDQIHIQLSQRMVDDCDLDNNYLQINYYNENNDRFLDSLQEVVHVSSRSYKNDGTPNDMELFDLGNSFDVNTGDGIYANYLIGDFNEFYTGRYIIDIQCDSIGRRMNFSLIPVETLLFPPRIVYPTNTSIINSKEIDILWQSDSSDIGGVMLFEDHSNMNVDSMQLIWEKRYQNVEDGYISESVPYELKSMQSYLLLTWSSSNYNRIYSFDWSCFSVDTTQNDIDELLLKYYPNPFLEKINIKFLLLENKNISLKIYDITGRKIISFHEYNKQPGEHILTWDGRNKFGEQVSAGVYICRFICGDVTSAHKVLLLK